jgi:hypothetical protein
MDDQEPGLAGVQVRDATETYLGYSDAVGNYRVYVDLNNTYTVAPTAPPSQWTCNTWVAGELTEPMSGSQTATVDINSVIANGNDFGYYFVASVRYCSRKCVSRSESKWDSRQWRARCCRPEC